MRRMVKLIIPIFILGTICQMPSFIYGQTEPNDEITQLNQQIKDKQDRITKMQDQQQVYENIVQQKNKEKKNLANQLAILENLLAKAELDLESTKAEIDQVNLEIKKVNLEINDKNQQINRQKEHITTVLQLMQKQDDKSALEVILLNNSFADYINQTRYLEDINNEIGKSLDALKKYKAELEEQRKVLADKMKELADDKDKLELNKNNLAYQQNFKIDLLDQTRSSEKEYQRLLNLARQEQEQAAADIVNLEKVVRAKIAKTQGKALEFSDAGFIWPVLKNTIVAYFHDPDYPFRYIFEHPAVDIRAVQGSTIRAAASGYIAQAKDAGKGYSYIMIIHGNGLATVYGHVSKIYVSNDDYVVQGQAIGLSGGLPGTAGAGRLTTGPHLHFEVRLNGVPVDPEEYLPR